MVNGRREMGGGEEEWRDKVHGQNGDINKEILTEWAARWAVMRMDGTGEG